MKVMDSNTYQFNYPVLIFYTIVIIIGVLCTFYMWFLLVKKDTQEKMFASITSILFTLLFIISKGKNRKR